MLNLPSKTLTLAEFLKLSETKPASEYIDGQIIPKESPQGKHSVIQGELLSTINQVVKSKLLARAFPELRCTFGGGTHLEETRSLVPDIVVFTVNRIPRNQNGEVANAFMLCPDWTIEILSPDQSQTRVTKNILHCLKYGTEMGWLIDPNEQTVFIFRPKQEIEVCDQPHTYLSVPSFAKELKLSNQNLFAWLLD